MTTVAHDNAQTNGVPAQPSLGGPVAVTGSKLGVPHRPQVNLLPPEVTHRRLAAAAQRRMIWTLIGVLVLIALVFGAAFLVRADAAIKQEESLATADALLAQKREFSPVVEVINSIEDTQRDREYALLNEVNWASYVYALAAVLPEGVTIDSLEIMSAGAGDGLVEGADVLTTNAIGVITFTTISPTLPDASAWIDAVESVPGLADANLQSVELTDAAAGVGAAGEDDVETETTYEVNMTAQVTVDAAAHRQFADAAAGEAATEAPADNADADAADAEEGE